MPQWHRGDRGAGESLRLPRRHSLRPGSRFSATRNRGFRGLDPSRMPRRPVTVPDRGERAMDRLALPAALAAMSVVAVIIIIRKSIWADEAITMDETAGSFGRMLEMVRETSSKPPVYFAVV